MWIGLASKRESNGRDFAETCSGRNTADTYEIDVMVTESRELITLRIWKSRLLHHHHQDTNDDEERWSSTTTQDKDEELVI